MTYRILVEEKYLRECQATLSTARRHKRGQHTRRTPLEDIAGRVLALHRGTHDRIESAHAAIELAHRELWDYDGHTRAPYRRPEHYRCRVVRED